MEHDLLDVVFGLDHMIAEFFWNGVFLAIGLGISKIRAYKKIHKYIDNKHGVHHKESDY